MILCNSSQSDQTVYPFFECHPHKITNYLHFFQTKTYTCIQSHTIRNRVNKMGRSYRAGQKINWRMSIWNGFMVPWWRNICQLLRTLHIIYTASLDTSLLPRFSAIFSRTKTIVSKPIRIIFEEGSNIFSQKTLYFISTFTNFNILIPNNFFQPCSRSKKSLSRSKSSKLFHNS